VIAQLTGKIAFLDLSSAIVDVAGVGYSLQITATTSKSLSIGQQVTLATALIVREDDMSLYGFISQDEKRVFDLLRSVTGVGPKSALAVLGSLGLEEIAAAVMNDDDAAFKKVSGIGPKTAKLITVTLAGKLTSTQKPVQRGEMPSRNSVVLALVGLGWSEKSAAVAVEESLQAIGADAANDLLLRTSLARLSGGQK
jgi:holliday junction DNA helicase RuvA